MPTEETNQFAHRIAVDFDLGELTSIAPMQGSSNRLWRLCTSTNEFVAKELPYDAAETLTERRQAAAFEARLIEEQQVVAPRPVSNLNGEYVSIMESS